MVHSEETSISNITEGSSNSSDNRLQEFRLQEEKSSYIVVITTATTIAAENQLIDLKKEELRLTVPLASNVTNMVNESKKSPKPYEYKRLLLRTEEDFAMARKLQEHFVLRDECAFELNHYYQNETNFTRPAEVTSAIRTKYCPTAADYLLCFPTTLVNQTVFFKCPYKAGVAVAHQDVICKLKTYSGNA